MLNSQIHRKNQRISVFLAAWTIIIVIIGWVLFRLIAGSDDFNRNRFFTQQAVFAKTVAMLHSQWMYENRPDSLKMVGFQVVGNDIKSMSLQKISDVKDVEMNKAGWPQPSNLSNACETLWTLVTEAEKIREGLVVETKIMKNTKHKWIRCRYYYMSEFVFDYDSFNGKVSPVGDKEIE